MARSGRGWGQTARAEAGDPVVDGVERARPLTKFSIDYFQSTITDELLLSVRSCYEIPDNIHLIFLGYGDPDLPDIAESEWMTGLHWALGNVQALGLARHYPAYTQHYGWSATKGWPPYPNRVPTEAAMVTQYKDLDFSFLEEQNLVSTPDVHEKNRPKPLPTSKPAKVVTTPLTDQIPLAPPA
ncbi:hypothetical protein PanWU01x14_321490 [Parasponia andersonii]|uniref:Uncharacterized protein n=1 Tax=Parasponia andersonii TaxID=3476 RepID=A0A2P5ALA5_PARAD|nr:hypothetical protein PanWU01x14_321490 [Parasponia andersonii]